MSRKPRVAFFSPLPPVRSGIADYTEDLLPDLAALATVDVVTERDGTGDRLGFQPARVRSLCDYLRGDEAYDVNVYQVGNNVEHHGYVVPLVRQRPGILVLHDYCLHYLVLGLTLGRGDLSGLERTLRAQYGGAARRLTWQLLLNAVDPMSLSFSGEMIRASRMVIVHSEYARGRVLADHPGVDVRLVPMGVRECPPPPPARSTELRRRVGVAPEDLIVASVSTPAHNKRLDLLVRAFGRALTAHPNLRLVIFGAGLLARAVRSEINRLPAGTVIQTGWLSGPDYRDLIALSDVVVDLRYPAAAETSASLLRAMAAGKPAIVADQGPFSELPGDACVRVRVGAGEETPIAMALMALMADSALRRRMGAAAQAYVRRTSTPRAAAAAYANHLADAARPSAAPPTVAGSAPRVRPLVAGMYNVGRVGRLWRTYGSADTWRRIREEVRREAR